VTTDAVAGAGALAADGASAFAAPARAGATVFGVTARVAAAASAGEVEPADTLCAAEELGGSARAGDRTPTPAHAIRPTMNRMMFPFPPGDPPENRVHRKRGRKLVTIPKIMRSRRPPKPPVNEQGTDPGAARDTAVALLARRDFASAELRERLAGRGFSAPAAAAAVSGLIAEGIVNDERYAQNYVTYQAGRGRGPVRIGADLRARGLPQALIDAALEAGPDWRALARAARSRRFGRQPPESWREKARQARFLQYRGFSADHIRAATGADSDAD
jgi:regulatory protein